MRKIEIYDTTLRDGAQSEEISFSVEDKMRITERLDDLGVHYIEGGYPGSNPRDIEYFRKAARLKLRNARIVAFGSTHRPKKKPSQDEAYKDILDEGAGVITIFGKTWDFHVREALRISLEENLEIIYDSLEYLKRHAQEVFYDAEHFFDGYKANPEYAIRSLQAAEQANADCIILCDTNGGTMPFELVE